MMHRALNALVGVTEDQYLTQTYLNEGYMVTFQIPYGGKVWRGES